MVLGLVVWELFQSIGPSGLVECRPAEALLMAGNVSTVLASDV